RCARAHTFCRAAVPRRRRTADTVPAILAAAHRLEAPRVAVAVASARPAPTITAATSCLGKSNAPNANLAHCWLPVAGSPALRLRDDFVAARVVLIEAAAGLLPEPAGGDVLTQQRAWAVL